MAGAFFLLSIGATVPAAAQGNWLTTSWQVTEVGGTMGPANLAFLTSQLQQSSRWLEALGFATPKFLPTRDARGVNRYQGFYDAGLTSACGNVAALYDGNSQVLRFGTLLFALDSLTILDPHQLTDGRVTATDGYLLTSVHEVFHGVQYAYQDNWPPEVKWFIESAAEAVRYAWGAKTYGTIDRHQRFTYDLPLHEPFAGAGCSANTDFYRTGHFWYDVGEDIGSPDRVGYLKGILAAFTNGTDARRGGIGPIAAGLQAHDGGLYNLYPQFIARHAADSSYYRYERIVDLSPTNLRVIDRTPQLQPTKELAASAWVLRVSVPLNTTAGLTVQLEMDHPDLHLIVDTTRYDRPAPRKQRNVFRTALQGRAAPYEFLVRVANVAPDPAGSVERPYTIEFRLAEVTPCDPRQLWSAVHPAAQAFLVPLQQYQNQQATTPGSEPAEGQFTVQGLVSDGGTSCTHPVTVASNPAAPDRNMGLQLQQRVSQMSPQELQAMAQRMAARMQGGGPPTPDELANAVRAEPMVDSVVTMSSLIHVFSPNAIYWQRGAQPPAIGLGTLSGYTQDKPAVAWSHSGVGGWQPNSGAQAMIIIQDVAPEELREDTTYRAVAAMHYSRGEGVMKTSRSGTTPMSDGTWQGLEGWIEQVESDANTEMYSLKGTVHVERVTGATIEGTFDLSGVGQYQRADCPKNPINLAIISRKCRTDVRSGAITITGRFVAPAVRTARQ